LNYIEYLARIIREQLADGLPVVLASIVSQQGSAPRNTGTKMVIGADGKSYGTIGGSLLESTSVQKGGYVISRQKPAFLEFDLSGEGPDSAGMICGGKTLVLLDYIAPTLENRKFFQGFNDAVTGGNDFYLLTYLEGYNDNLQIAGRHLLFSNDKEIGKSPLSSVDIERLKSALHDISTIEILKCGNIRVVIDRIEKLSTLYCFGAGHVAAPTAYIASLVGFRVVVLDDRPEFANSGRFPEAYHVGIIKDFDHAFDGLDIDSDSFIVILTRGHRFDRTVLEQALKTKAGYIGMISSKKKKEAIYQALLTEGFPEEALWRVHAPIGIAVGAQTPEEIAVSIVAELISRRRGLRK
jgi:xanthine dehydrogenase accessory factor